MVDVLTTFAFAYDRTIDERNEHLSQLSGVRPSELHSNELSIPSHYIINIFCSSVRNLPRNKLFSRTYAVVAHNSPSLSTESKILRSQP